MQALEEALRLLPREGANEGDADEILRPNSQAALARQALLEAGKPLHVEQLIKALGKSDTRANRSAMAGSIGAYVRKGEIFSRTAPNTFGLIELQGQADDDKERHSDPFGDVGEPPASFGLEDTHEPDDDMVISDKDVPF